MGNCCSTSQPVSVDGSDVDTYLPRPRPPPSPDISYHETDVANTSNVSVQTDCINFRSQSDCSNEDNVSQLFEVNELLSGGEKWKGEKEQSLQMATHRNERLTSYHVDEVKQLLERKDPLKKGGYGDIFVCNQLELMGTRRNIAIKRIQCQGRDTKRKSAINEMAASRLKHFNIVPLLGLTNDIDMRCFYFIMPYFDKGDLCDAIQDDRKRCQDGTELRLSPRIRLKILYHIAQAMAFMHMNVHNFRGPYVHGDITSRNIVLDSHFNARLLDFGKALEIFENGPALTTSDLLGTDGYFQTAVRKELTVLTDGINFGVVTRELVTGSPHILENKRRRLIKMDDKAVLSDFRKDIQKIWNGVADLPMILVDISTRCIQKEENSSKLVDKIENEIRSRNWNSSYEWNEEHLCEVCLENKKVVNNSLLNHPNSCKIAVCVSCLQNSYFNPLKCPSCHKDIKSPVGHGWCAMLIAGPDTKNQSITNPFQADLERVYKAITGRVPLVMGIRKEHVRCIYQRDGLNRELLEPKLHQAITHLKSQKDTHALLLYITGHHGEDGFCLGEKERFQQENIEQLIVKGLPHIKKIIVFVDCCNPPPRQWTLEGVKVFQLSSSASSQVSWADEKGSLFTEALVRCLYGKGFSRPCIIDSRTDKSCSICTDKDLLAKFSDGFISTNSIHEYVERHLKEFISHNSECPTYAVELCATDTKLAFYTRISADITVMLSDGIESRRKRVAVPDLPDDILSFKLSLLTECSEKASYWAEKYPEIINMFIKRGSKEDIVELHSMEDIERALYSHHQIYAGVRKVAQVKHGSVGLLLKRNNSDRILMELGIAAKSNSRDISFLNSSSKENVRISIGEGMQKVHEHIITVDDVALKLLEDVFIYLRDAEELKGSNGHLELMFPRNQSEDTEDKFDAFILVKISDLEI